MANVTDAVFRAIIAKYSCTKCNDEHAQSMHSQFITWTEFTSVEALCSDGRQFAQIDLTKIDDHSPTVAQIFGSKPEQFKRVAKEIAEAKVFDGIDINMGCPEKSIEKSGAGAALMKNPKLAKEIILATKKGAGPLPVSVKTRLGYNKNELESWTSAILEAKPSAIIMHLRTRKEMSKVPADWSQIEVMRKLIDQLPESERPILIGNGDVENVEQGRALCKKYGADGVMLGRAVFGNPWLFRNAEKPSPAEGGGHKSYKSYTTYTPTVQERLEALLEHTKLYIDTFGPDRKTRKTESSELKERDWLKNFDYMKKHYKAYCNGFTDAKELRIKLMEAESYSEIEKSVKSFTKNRKSGI
ncbi:MAG: tRNA-dihydrouridine synthase [bacterium]|nr:tRNA-dihydrouridine synthase [bacterium]